MQAALKLFSRTLSKIPFIQSKIPSLYQNLTFTTPVYTLEQSARLVHMSQLIFQQIAELQSQTSVSLINSFFKRYDQIQYDYEARVFKLKKYGNDVGLNINYRLSSVGIEKFDHPFFRNSLYFHQIKDAGKYYEFQVPSSFPKYMQDLYRKMLADQTLDQNNPLGVPHWQQPLNLIVKIQMPQKSHKFHLISKLGKATLLGCSWQGSQSQQPFRLNAKLFDDKMQRNIFKILQQKAGINQYQLQQMSKLKFIGGCADRIEAMTNIFQLLSSAQQYQKNEPSTA